MRRDSLSDSEPTFVTITSSKYTAISGDAFKSYYVTRGGITYVAINFKCVTPATASEAICTLPRPVFTTNNFPNARDYYNPSDMVSVLLQGSTLYFIGGSAGTNYGITFCYPPVVTT